MALPVLPLFTTTPNRNNPATFSADTDQYHIELTPFVPLLNIWAIEVNALGDEIFIARDTSVNAKDIALSTVNYKGDYVNGTYNLNESVTYTDGFNYVSKTNGNTDIPTTSNWYRVPNIDDSATTIYQMWSSSKIDTELTNLETDLTQTISNGLALKVNIDGNQTINDIKTFTDSPIVPTPADADNSKKTATTEFVKTAIAIPQITGTATFNTLNNIQLAGIGLISIERGDVIEISGAINSENNGLFTVEVINPDGNNIIVNQAHAGKSTSKSFKSEILTPNISVKIFAKWGIASIGLGRAFVDLTSQRTTGQVYTNDTGRDFKGAITITGPGGTIAYMTLDSDSNFLSISIPGASGTMSVTPTIPAGSTYLIPTNVTIVEFKEQR